MSETLCSSAASGAALGRLPAIQTHGHAGISGDSAVLRHRHRSMLRGFRVVRSTLQTEPLGAALAAPQWFRIGRRNPPPIIKMHNAIHERR